MGYKKILSGFLLKIIKLIQFIIYPFSSSWKYKRIKLKNIKQSHCVNFEDTEKQDLVKKISKEGYVPKKGLIAVGIDNKITNGNHRYCLLLEKYGEEHTIIVRKNYTLYDIVYTQITIITILILPFYLPYYFIKKNKK
jgi:hypothetical protein